MAGVQVGEKLLEGKTKIIYAHPEDPSSVIMYFKDDITAGDGATHDVIAGKGTLHWEANKNIFELLNSKGIQTHYKHSPAKRYTVVDRLDEKYELEVVARRIATGSFLKRYPEVAEGLLFNPLKVEFFYKDDVLNDPMVDERHLQLLLKQNPVYRNADSLVRATFAALEEKFLEQDHQLIDLKIEVGRVEDTIVVTDEITADSFRLWPYKSHKDQEAVTKTLRAEPQNVLQQNMVGFLDNVLQENMLRFLDKEGMKDKQVYRDGGSLATVKTGFEKITEMTRAFNK